MTDRASAEGLREADYLWLIWFARKSKGTVDEVAQRALEQHPGLRAALRDTGPRPDSGIDVERLAKVFARALEDQDFTGFRNWLALAREVAAEYARLSTPRTETSEP